MIQFEDIKNTAQANRTDAFEARVERVVGVQVGVDSTDNAAVANRPGWVYWKAEGNPEGNVSQARANGSTVAGRTVILERIRPTGIWQVVGTDESQLAYADDFTGQNLTDQHADQHAVAGADPLYVELQALKTLLVAAKSGLTVNVAPLRYGHQGSVVKFGGADVDLTSNVPGTANEARFVLVYLDTSANAIATANGATGPDTPTYSLAIPTLPDGDIPAALVRLANGQTTISNVNDIKTYRLLFEPFNGLDNSRVSKLVASDGTPDPALAADAAGALTASYQLTTAASTTSAASLVIPAGTLPSSPLAGEMAFDGEALHFTTADGVHRSIPLANGIVTSDTTVANTVTETTVYTETIGANELHAGQVVQCRVLGRYSTANASDTFTLRCKIAGTTIATLTSTAANVTDVGVEVVFTFTVRTGGASGSAWWHAKGIFNDDLATNVATSTATIDTTAADNVTVTVEWSAANASNSLTISQGWCQFVE